MTDTKPTTTITIPTEYLRACFDLAPKDDIRYYLNGVYLNNKGYLDVTSGHYAARFECEELKELPESVVLYRQQLDFYLKKLQASGGKEGTDITVNYVEQSIVLEGKMRNGTEVSELGDIREGRYPDLSRFINFDTEKPEKQSTQEWLLLNWDYAALFQKALKRIAKHGFVELKMKDGQASAWSSEVPGFKGVIMPIRRN